MESPCNNSTVAESADALLKKAVISTEKAISWARIFWGSALIMYTLSLWNFCEFASMVVSIVPIIVLMLISWYFVRILKQERLPQWLTFASVTMDCMVAVLSLLPNILWPSDSYTGISDLIDTSGLMICVFAAGFRLSIRVAVWGSILIFVFYFFLIWLDYHINSLPIISKREGYILFSIYLLGCAALAIILARHTRFLVKQSAQEAAQNAVAKHALNSVMQGHHDMKSILTSAAVGVELLCERLNNCPNGTMEESNSMAKKLSFDLQRLCSAVHSIKNEAFGRIMNLQSRQTVGVQKVIECALSCTSRDFAHVKFKSHVSQVHCVHINGGKPALERILLNLLVNSCEGNGSIGANHIDISARPTPNSRFVEFQIEDDGPGFDEEILRGYRENRFLSRKQGGSGMGLLTVRYLLGDQVSTLLLQNKVKPNKEVSGALVRFKLGC